MVSRSAQARPEAESYVDGAWTFGTVASDQKAPAISLPHQQWQQPVWDYPNHGYPLNLVVSCIRRGRISFKGRRVNNSLVWNSVQLNHTH